MIVITGGRASGKTTTLVRWLLEDPSPRCIITSDRRRREEILRKLRSMMSEVVWNRTNALFWEERVFIIPDEPRGMGGIERWGSRGYHLPFTEIGIDDAETVMHNLFSARVEIVAFNGMPISLGGGSEPDRH